MTRRGAMLAVFTALLIGLLGGGLAIGFLPVKMYGNDCGSAFFPSSDDASDQGTTNLGAVVCSSVASRKPVAIALLAGGLGALVGLCVAGAAGDSAMVEQR